MEDEVLRNRMVERQLIPRGIKDQRVLKAFGKVPRHKFVPQEFVSSAYEDHPLPIGEGQTISQPYMVALMSEQLNLSGKQKVLEIGTGSGYQAAILAELAKEVYSLERLEPLAERAKKVLAELGYSNIKIKISNGTLGWEEFSPYDGIIVTAGAPDVPQALVEQLSKDGRMVIPIGGMFSQVLTLVEKVKRKVKLTEICSCVFVPLVGEQGWRNNCQKV